MGAKLTRMAGIGLPLACAMLIASGCGGDDGGPEVAEEDPVEAPAPPVEPDADEPEEASGVAGRVLDACRRIVERAPGLPEGTRRELIEECEEAAADDEEAARRAAGAACDVIAALTVPGPLRGPAASACRRAIPGSTRL